MKRLAEIEAAYLRLDAHLDELRATAAAHQLSSLETSQTLNDQAYFVLCWGQMETEINERCADVITARQQHSEWQVRRGWDRYDAGDLRRSGLSFEERAAIALDRKAKKPNNYGRAMQHYAVRNQIAHGKLLSRRVDVVEAIADFYVIASEIKRHAP